MTKEEASQKAFEHQNLVGAIFNRKSDKNNHKVERIDAGHPLPPSTEWEVLVSLQTPALDISSVERLETVLNSKFFTRIS